MTNLISGLPGTFTEQEINNLTYHSTHQESWLVTNVVTRETKKVIGILPVTHRCAICNAPFGEAKRFQEHEEMAH